MSQMKRLALVLSLLITTTAVTAKGVDPKKTAQSHRSHIKTTNCVSYIEIVRFKDRNDSYMNKVFIAADGRKRYESFTSEQGLISIFDDWGIQRLFLNPIAKTATTFEANEEHGEGENLAQWLKDFKDIVDNADTRLGTKDLYRYSATGFSAQRGDTSCDVWINDSTREPTEITIDMPDRVTRLIEIAFHKEVADELFSFGVPVGYTVVERHLAQKKN